MRKRVSKQIIPRDEVHRWERAKYRVVTIVPLVESPTMEIYHMDQDGLDDFLEGYNEYAQFIVRVEIIEP